MLVKDKINNSVITRLKIAKPHYRTHCYEPVNKLDVVCVLPTTILDTHLHRNTNNKSSVNKHCHDFAKNQIFTLYNSVLCLDFMNGLNTRKGILYKCLLRSVQQVNRQDQEDKG